VWEGSSSPKSHDFGYERGVLLPSQLCAMAHHWNGRGEQEDRILSGRTKLI
jgi:hypothetical protein